MISALFTTEVSALENQVAHLQAQIMQAQERISQLGACETQAGSAVQMLQDAVTRIAGLAPSAVAALKASVLNLFNSGDGGSQVEQPVGDGPAPLPASPDGEVKSGNSRLSSTAGISAGSELDIALQEQLVASETELPADKPVSTTLSADAPELNGQHSVLCCHLVDAPLMGQYCELTCQMTSNVVPLYEGEAIEQPPTIEKVAISIAAEDSLFKLIEVTPLLSYMKRSDDGQIFATYVGFNSKSKAKQWSEWLSLTHSVATKAEVRVAKRLTAFKYEVKCSGVSFKSIERLAQCDFNKEPRSVYPDAAPIKVEKTPSLAEHKAILAAEKIAQESIQPPLPTLPYIAVPIGRNGAASNWKALQASGGLNLKKHGTGLTTLEETEAFAQEQKRMLEARVGLREFQIGDVVTIKSARHGEALLGLPGIIKVSNAVGCVVDVSDQTRWFCVDEIQLLEEDNDIDF